MKKILSTICVLSLVLTMSITAFATDTTSATDTNETNVKNPQIHQMLEDKKAKRDAFHETVQGKREIIKSQISASKEIMEANHLAKKTLNEKLKAIKESGEEIDSDILEQLKDYNAQIKALNEDIKSTKGSIKTIVDGKIKPLVKAKDYEELENALDNFKAIQAQRNAKIAEITELINKMSELIS